MSAKRASVATWKTKSKTDQRDKDVLAKIGSLIKKFRQLKGFTQKQLADQIGLSQNHLSNIETGRREPGLLFMFRLAETLQVPIDLLLIPAYQPSFKDEAKAELAKDLQEFVVTLIDEIESNKQK